MLCMMHVRNFAIIDEVQVEFTAGMNVLTGETGAGKSILIDALGLLLGERATTDVIRADQDRAEIAATFEPGEAAREWLVDRALDAGDECHLRRVIARDGRARGFINGNPATMQNLRELGGMLVNIHGQHEHQALTAAQTQRALLDARGDYGALLADVSGAWQQWRDANEALEALRNASSEDADRSEFLRFQLSELDVVAVEAGEFERLEVERLKLASATDVAERGERAMQALSEADSTNALALIATSLREIEPLAELGSDITEILSMLREAETSVNEASIGLQRFLSSAEADPARLAEVERRTDDIRSLARKHRCTPDEIHTQAERLRHELSKLDNATYEAEALEQTLDQSRAAYDKLSRALSKKRIAAAKRFSQEVSNDMQALGMQGGRFEVGVTSEAETTPQAYGIDQIRFEVTANPGQPLQRLAKVASGGELSRISLAIQVAASQRKGVASMIFDEVDSGVGGGVAEVVGRKMRDLAATHQVLAVTHLPQVAGQAHQHLKVTKMTDGKTTRTKIVSLSFDERIEEIARMLGGVEITATTREHAREMLASASG